MIGLHFFVSIGEGLQPQGSCFPPTLIRLNFAVSGGWASDVAVSPAGSVNPRGTHNHCSPQCLRLCDEVQDQRSRKSLLALKSYLDINKVILTLQLPNLQLYILAFNSICLLTSGMAAIKRGRKMLRSEVCRFCYEIKWKCWACSVSSN